MSSLESIPESLCAQEMPLQAHVVALGAYGFEILDNLFLGHKLSVLSVLRPARAAPFADNILIACPEMDFDVLKPFNCLRKRIRISGLENIYDITLIFDMFNRFHPSLLSTCSARPRILNGNLSLLPPVANMNSFFNTGLLPANLATISDSFCAEGRIGATITLDRDRAAEGRRISRVAAPPAPGRHGRGQSTAGQRTASSGSRSLLPQSWRKSQPRCQTQSG